MLYRNKVAKQALKIMHSHEKQNYFKTALYNFSVVKYNSYIPPLWEK